MRRVLPLLPAGVAAALLAVASALWASLWPLSPAHGQDAGARMAGRWQCTSTIDDPSGRLVTSTTRYVIVLYPNGSFAAQGVSQGGVSTMSFQAQGNWRVWQENGVWYIAARGQQVTVFQTGQRVPTTHITFGRIYSLSQFGHRSTTQDGRNLASFCQRAG